VHISGFTGCQWDCITYKTVILVHKVLATLMPAYLSDLVCIAEPSRLLLSSHVLLLSVPRIRTQISRRAFSVIALSVWNSLSDNTRLCKSTDTFKRHLKAYLFNMPYSLAPLSASVSPDTMAHGDGLVIEMSQVRLPAGALLGSNFLTPMCLCHQAV